MAKEQRIIDANALVENSDVFIMHTKEYGSIEVIPVEQVGDAPTVEAVEVVRCKDCKHWHEETGWCTQHSHFIGRDSMACHPSQSSEWKMFNADDFCSCGERKDNG